MYCIIGDRRYFGGKNNGHDDTIYSHHFAKYNGDQILGPDSRCLYATSKDGDTSDENTPIDSIRYGLEYVLMAQESIVNAYHAAPTTDRPMQSAMPKSAQT